MRISVCMMLVLTVAAAPAVCRAGMYINGIDVTFDVAATSGLEGFATWTVTIDTGASGEIIRAVDAAGFVASQAGGLNQVGADTIFQDDAGGSVTQDSHFLLDRADLIVVGNPSVTFEDDTELTAAFAFPQGSPLADETVVLAQLVMPVGVTADFELSLAIEISGELQPVVEVAGATPLGGDADMDGDVDLEDLFIVRNHFGGSGGWSEGDFDLDGTIALEDLFILRNNFGAGLAGAPSSSAMPEPASVFLLAIGAAALKTRRR